MIKKRSYTLLVMFILAILFLVGCSNRSGLKGDVKIPRLNPKYSFRDKEPMGSYIAYHYTQALFKNSNITIRHKSFSNQWYEISHAGSLYFILARTVFFSKQDISYILNYVAGGNTLFVSSSFIDFALLDTLGINMQTDIFQLLNFNEYRLSKKETWVTLSDPKVSENKRYSIFYLPFEDDFSQGDSSRAGVQVLGVNELNKPNFIAVNYGKGKFIFHAAPVAFSNYFLLKPGNLEYMEKAFSYLSSDIKNIYWDNYYRIRTSQDNFSIINFFKKHPSLYFALLLLLSLLLLYLTFGGKRRQRIIPLRTRPSNTTVSYTETIGRLYLTRKDNNNIARKMISFFLDHVRSHYYLNTQILNYEFVESLSGKSGVALSKTNRLLAIIQDLENDDHITDTKLLELHNLLQEFIKN